MIRRYLLLLMISLPFVLPAQSPAKLIEMGRYDDAIEASIKRVEKGRGDMTENYASLKMAYERCDVLDGEVVRNLKAKGTPDIWYDVFITYFTMQQRYEKLATIQERLQADHVNIQLKDYTEDLEAARIHAVTYLYAHSQSLLKTGVQDDALQAYLELLKITKLMKEYKDVELLMRKALGAGFRKALLEVKNRSDITLSPDYISAMADFGLKYQEKQFLDYEKKAAHGESFPLLLSIEINSIDVSPGTVNKKEYTTSHKNPESLDQAYEDAAKKEQDKKHPDYNKCQITEIYQVKTAVIKGKVKYIDGHSGTLLYVVPVTARSFFENRTATASGDLFACPPEIYEILDKPKKEFPDNADMITEAGKEFKALVKDVIWNETFIKY